LLASALKVTCNTPTNTLFANVANACRRGFPSVVLTEAHGGHAVLCGSGPSLVDTIDEIRFRQNSGQIIFALNNAGRTLAAHGIEPDYMVMLDARPTNRNFVGHWPGCRYLMGSTCDPGVLNVLVGEDVTLFHPLSEGIEEHITGDAVLIGGGLTVGLTAMALVHTLGYRNLHLYGYDSSFRDDKTHALPQPIGREEAFVDTATVADRAFRTNYAMAAQADLFPMLAAELAENGATITVHGDGLLPTVAREMLRPPEPDSEQRKYERMWTFESYRKYSPGERLFERGLAELGIEQGDSVIDFGCGPGRATAMFAERGFNVIGVDIAANCLDPNLRVVPFMQANLWELPADLSADYGYCCDVMEHISPDKVDAVLSEISRCTRRRVFFNISFSDDNFGALIEDHLHLSVHSPEWWLAKLKEHFAEVAFKDGIFVCDKSTSAPALQPQEKL
jgi:SAM-dependent methyltransferase